MDIHKEPVMVSLKPTCTDQVHKERISYILVKYGLALNPFT